MEAPALGLAGAERGLGAGIRRVERRCVRFTSGESAGLGRRAGTSTLLDRKGRRRPVAGQGELEEGLGEEGRVGGRILAGLCTGMGERRLGSVLGLEGLVWAGEGGPEEGTEEGRLGEGLWGLGTGGLGWEEDRGARTVVLASLGAQEGLRRWTLGRRLRTTACSKG